MTRVLIISYWFPPLNTIAALRVYAFAKYLRESGYDVTVLTSPAKQTDKTDDNIDISDIPVVEVDFHLADSIDVVNNIRQSKSSGNDLQKGYARKILQVCERAKNYLMGNLITPEDFWLFSAFRKADCLHQDNRYDMILSSSGPISAHFVAFCLKSKYPEIVWFADYRDMWSYNDLFERPKWPLNLLQRKLETLLNNNTSYLITVSEPLREILHRKYRGAILLIENGYFPEDLRREDEGDIQDDGRWRLVHTGTIYSKYDIEPLLLALNELIGDGTVNRGKLNVLFCGDNTNQLRQTVDKHALSDVVVLSGKIARKQSLHVQRSSSALLFLGHDTALTKGVLTGKIFEYLVSGRPIIAMGIGRDCSAGQLIEQSNAGVVCGNDIELIKAVIRKSIAGWSPEPNRDVIGMYSRDKLVARLCDVLDREFASHQTRCKSC